MKHNWEKYFDITSVYWEKLQNLYKENDSYPKVVTSGRNLHHKFMRSFSRLEGIEIDNDKENLVSLSEGDHFLAHYYLWKCTKTGFKNRTANAVKWMYKKSMKYLDDDTVETIAKAWTQKTFNPDFTTKGLHYTEEQRQRISKSKKGKKQNWDHAHTKGRHWYNNGINQVMAYECPEGYVEGRLK